MKTLVLALLAALVVQIPADPDGPLEPSVMNEVEHALARAPACATKSSNTTPAMYLVPDSLNSNF